MVLRAGGAVEEDDTLAHRDRRGLEPSGGLENAGEAFGDVAVLDRRIDADRLARSARRLFHVGRRLLCARSAIWRDSNKHREEQDKHCRRNAHSTVGAGLAASATGQQELHPCRNAGAAAAFRTIIKHAPRMPLPRRGAMAVLTFPFARPTSCARERRPLRCPRPDERPSTPPKSSVSPRSPPNGGIRTASSSRCTSSTPCGWPISATRSPNGSAATRAPRARSKACASSISAAAADCCANRWRASVRPWWAPTPPRPTSRWRSCMPPRAA